MKVGAKRPVAAQAIQNSIRKERQEHSMAGSASTTRGGAEERILATAASLFARFGYNGVSTREIAAAADVNEVTIYRHFPRKRDLYLAVMSAELQRVHLRGELLSKLAGAADGRAALASTFELISAALAQEPQLLRLLGFSVLELSEDLDPLLRKHLGELVEVLARYLEPWIANGEIRTTNAKTLVLTLIAIVLSRGPLQRVFSDELGGADTLFDAFKEFCLA